MSDSMDRYVRQALKNWAVRHQPPANGRARLLLVAANPASQQVHLVNEYKYKLRDLFNRGEQPQDPRIELYNLPLLWAGHVSSTPIRRVA
jgi:hypothetical protein